MRKTLIGMGIAVVMLCVITFMQGGWTLLGNGLFLGGRIFVTVIPLIIVAFTLAGMISILVSEEVVSRLLGKEAGLKGILLASVAGAVIPGGPFIFYPIAATLLVSGAEIGAAISFVAAKVLWTVSRLPVEVALLGPKITFIRYGVTFIFPILVGLAANALFSGHTVRIREEIRLLQRSDKA
ncbi:MAG: permease [Deltaproteobacteria bacterium]|nr:permease [Deltaproteobacteria bacterium]